MKVNVVILIYVSYHPVSKWLVVLPDERLNLLSYGREEMKRTMGSGTPIANIFVRIDNKYVFNLPSWFSNKFSLEVNEINKFLGEQELRF